MIEPTTIEVYSDSAEFTLHRRRECFHDCDITIKSCTDELNAIRWSRLSVSSRMMHGSMDVRELSPPVAKACLRMNVHNLRHCARGALGGTAVVGVVLLQWISPYLFGGKISLTQSRKEHLARQASCLGSQQVKKAPPGCGLPL